MAMEQALARNVERCCMFLFVSLGWKAFMRGNDTSFPYWCVSKWGMPGGNFQMAMKMMIQLHHGILEFRILRICQ